MAGYSPWGSKELDMTEVTEHACSKFHYVCHDLCIQILLGMHIASIPWITEKAREFQRNTYLCFIDYLKPFTVWITTNWKILQEMGIPDQLTCLLRNLYAAQEATVKLDMEQWTGSKLGKEYIKAVYCHLVYITSMQSTSSKMPDWMKHKLESRLPGEISITSDMQMIPPLWQKAKKN